MQNIYETIVSVNIVIKSIKSIHKNCILYIFLITLYLI